MSYMDESDVYLLKKELQKKKYSYMNEYNLFLGSKENLREKSYQILSSLGSGAFGTVSKVRMKYDPNSPDDKQDLKKEFALKIVQLNGNKETKSKNLIREVMAMDKFRHENITNLISYIVTVEMNKESEMKELSINLHLFMEYCPESLEDWMESNPSHDREYFKNIVLYRGACEGVRHMHSQGFIHRDLKPSNILIESNGFNVKIADFGLATLHNFRAFSKSQNMSELNEAIHSFCCGTPLYVAPEQFIGDTYDFKVDVYSLGCILLQLLAKFPDGESKDFNEKQESKKLLIRFRDDRKLDEIFQKGNLYEFEGDMIMAMTDPDPQKRPTIDEVIGTIEKTMLDIQESPTTSSQPTLVDSEKNVYIKGFSLDRDFADSFEMDQLVLIGKGNFNSTYVFKCTTRRKQNENLLTNPTFPVGEYALKKILLEDNADLANLAILRDLENTIIMRNNPHENIASYAFHWIDKKSSIRQEINLFHLSELCIHTLTDWSERKDIEWEPQLDSKIFKIMIETASGLKFLHSNNIIHRDLKPSNILLGLDKKWKISDFGHSSIHLLKFKSVKDYCEALKMKGIKSYASPEQLDLLMTKEPEKLSDYEKLKQEYKIDIYALGFIYQDLNAIQNQIQKIVLLMHKMIEVWPQDRPDSGQVLTQLNSIKDEMV